MLIPAGAVKGFIAALLFIGSMLGTVYWKLSDKLSGQEMLQREQGVKLDMMLDLWRQTAQDIKERPSRHEFDDLRQELRQGRKE